MPYGQQNEAFVSWGIGRKILLGVVVVTAIIFMVLLNVPVGLDLYLLLITVSFVWNEPGNVVGKRSDYDDRTIAYKWAQFCNVLKNQVRIRSVFTPVMLGFGPPTSDPDHQYEPGMTPPARLSSYWSLFAAIPFAFLDGLTQYLVYPVLMPFKFPWLICSIISFVFWFFTFQTCCAVLRFADWKNGMMQYADPAPAMMLTHAHRLPESRQVFIRSLLWGLIPATVILLVCQATHAPVLVEIPLILLAIISVWLVKTSRTLTNLYRAEWAERNARREFWEAAYAFKGASMPLFISENSAPSEEEWREEVANIQEAALESGEDIEDIEIPEYAPTIKFAAFKFAPNCHFADYFGDEDRIRGELGANLISIAPMGVIDNETGEEQVGTVGTIGFRVIWTETFKDDFDAMKEMFSKDVDPRLLDLSLRHFVLRPLSNIRGVGIEPTIRSCDFITRTTSPIQIIEVVLGLRDGLTLSTLQGSISQLQSDTGIQWIRFYSHKDDPSNVARMLLSEVDPETVERVRFYNPAQIVKSTLAAANWSYYFTKAGVLGGDMLEPPKMDGVVKSATPLVQEIDFVVPEGMRTFDVKGRVDSLLSSSSRQYMEITTPKSLDTSKMSSTEALVANQTHSRKVTILSARTDPLNRLFKFTDYKDELISGREPGTEKINWSPGVLSNDQMAVDSFDSNEAPMLLIAGMSGSGKRHPLDERIPVPVSAKFPNGWALVGDLEVGDVILTPDNNWTEIVSLSPVVERPAIRFFLDDGQSVSSDPEHVWPVSTQESRREAVYASPLGIPYLRHFVSKQYLGVSRDVRGLEIVSGLSESEVRTTLRETGFLDVYGDGEGAVYPVDEFLHLADVRHSASDYITPSFNPKLAHCSLTETKIIANGVLDERGAYRYAIPVPDAVRFGSNLDLPNDLTAEGKVTAKWERPIPSGILRSSILQRQTFLRGVMSESGSIRHAGGPCFAVVSNEEFARSLAELIRSLGIKCHFKQLPSEDGRGCFTLEFWTTLGVFEDDRTNALLPDEIPESEQWLFITYTLSEGDKPGRCLTVDDPSHLYLVGEFVPTHNTVTVHNFITQIAANNGPSDATFWLAEPKIGLQKYRNLDVVTKFVDSWYPSEEFFENMAEMSEEAVKIMVEKNRTLVHNPSKNGVIAEKLSDARKIARMEGSTGGTPHPLMMPYLFLVIEECATVFADAPSKEAKELQGRILANYARICREGRSAGVLLTCTTQYPTNASIPSILRQQMRRIGMRCQNSLSSNVVIDESGLEQINIKGAGKLKSENGEYRQFRGYMMDVDTGMGGRDDVNDILATLPSNTGAPSALNVPGRTKSGKQRIIIPGMSDSVMTEYEDKLNAFKEFDSRVGSRLTDSIQSGKRTRDIASDDKTYYELQKKFGMGIS